MQFVLFVYSEVFEFRCVSEVVRQKGKDSTCDFCKSENTVKVTDYTLHDAVCKTL